MTDLAAIKAELRTLLEKAKTKPPWTWVAVGPGEGDIALGGVEDPDGEFAVLAPHVCPSCAKRGDRCMAPSQSDAALIVAAVNALPALLADTPSVEPRLDGALRACEKALPDGWALLMGHDENGEWWATGSEPRDEVHHGYRIVSSSKDGVLYGTAAEALNALVALLPTQASDSPEKT